MRDGILFLLDLAQGPLFRFAFALMLLGLFRRTLLSASDVVAGYLTALTRADFKRKLRLHLLWAIFPSIALRELRPGGSRALLAYHIGICCLSIYFRAAAIVVAIFMVAHAYLWERLLGIAWPTLPPVIADTLTLSVIAAGFVLFLARLYSPVLRQIEPPWSFLKPLILILPFVTGVLAMHPTWSPVNYHTVLLLHVSSALVVFVLVPFARLLSCVHTRLERIAPSLRWRGAAAPEANRPLHTHATPATAARREDSERVISV